MTVDRAMHLVAVLSTAATFALFAGVLFGWWFL